jgi:LPS-assembly lipoprotein
MSSSDRRTVLGLLGTLPLLAACGFSPVHAPGTAARSLRGGVLVDEPATRAEFDLVRAVEDRLGRADQPLYGLRVVQDVSSDALAVQGSAAVTRYNLVGRADYVLTRLSTGEAVAAGSVNTFTSYSATASTVATASAERDARRRLSIALADLIVTDILLTLPETDTVPGT